MHVGFGLFGSLNRAVPGTILSRSAEAPKRRSAVSASGAPRLSSPSRLAPSRRSSVLVSGQQHHLEDGTQSLGVKTVSFGLNATTAAHSVQTRQDYAATGDSDLTAAIQTSTDYTVGNPSSATVKITERDLVPDPPTDLVVTHTHFDVDLSWTAPAFPGTHGSPIWYEIDLGELRSSIKNVTGTSQKELFSRINVLYRDAPIRVRAMNAYGEGEWSDQVLVTLRGAAITIAGNGPVTEGSDAVFTLTTDLVNRQKINGINTLAVNVPGVRDGRHGGVHRGEGVHGAVRRRRRHDRDADGISQLGWSDRLTIKSKEQSHAKLYRSRRAENAADRQRL